MNIKKKILYSSFKHLSFISDKKEREYWNREIFDLEKLCRNIRSQQTLLGESEYDLIMKSIKDIDNGNIQSIITELSKNGKRDYYRIAYSFPEDILFLDVETTGLSRRYHYVTVVGWIINGKYDYWMPGMNQESFINAFNKSKMIVTFNGTKFDCPFIGSTFKRLNPLEKPNLDLMYLCRLFGYTKGQKNIEQKLGFKRPVIVGQVQDGKEAIVLWYKFLFGENRALQLLLRYNFYDILGMAFILDYIFFEHIYGKLFPRKGRPTRFYRKIKSRKISIDSSIINRTRNYVRENISNFDMRKLSVATRYKIVGIDLAGVVSNTSKTGICVLHGQIANTAVVKENEEIIDYIEKEKPHIISIDAPLSIPYGRTSVYDDDPCRAEVGIMRSCERELKKRGVSVYPALIDSMQELTKRGIELSRLLRKKGYPVIECFPGAAQDVLQLPRKRTDETLLKDALCRLGIHGNFEENRKIYHDELDAITAAIVAQFFISEYYEAIGTIEENDLILPQIEKKNLSYEVVIGVAGPIATGKTLAAKYIRRRGYSYCRYSQVIQSMLDREKIPVDRGALQSAGWELFSKMEQYKLNKELEKLVLDDALVVIDGLRHPEDYTYWKERCFRRFFLIYVDSDYDLRKKRYETIEASGDYEKAVNHSVEAEVFELKFYADFVLQNNGSVDELHKEIDYTINEILSRIK